MQTRPLFDGLTEGHIARDDDDGNAAAGQRSLYGDLQDAGHLSGLRDELTIMAALREEMFGVSFLKISAADFVAWNLRRNSQHGNAATMAVVEPVDQMQVPGTAASGADGQSPCEMRFRSRGKRCGLFVSDVDPLNGLILTNGIGDAIERVAGNTIDLLNSCFRENIYEQVSYFLGHDLILSKETRETRLSLDGVTSFSGHIYFHIAATARANLEPSHEEPAWTFAGRRW